MNDMELVALHIERFKSFRTKQTFVFPTNPGLYFLTSRNDLHPTLGANGCGKSTVWDALAWLWFDKTPQGLRAGDVCPWGMDGGVCVTLDYRVGGKPFTLGRTWKPNKWWLEHDGQVDTLVGDESNLALAHLGTTLDPFLHSVLMSQGQPMFLDLKPEPMSALFGKVLQLDHWVECSTKASRAASMQDSVSRTLESRVARLDGALKEAQASTVHETFAEWERQRNKELDSLEESHGALAAARKKERAALENLHHQVDKARTAESSARNKLEEAHTRADACGGVLRGAKQQESLIQSRLRDVLDDIEAVKHADKCVACMRLWDSVSRRQRLDALQERAGSMREEIQALGISRLQRNWEKELDAVDEAKDAHAKCFRDLQDLEAEQVRRSQFYTKLGRDMEDIERQAERLANQRNPAQTAQDDIKVRTRRLLQELQECEDQLQDSHGSFMRKQFWVRGFKDIRLQQISSALTQLELEVNSAVEQLGLKGWRIGFDADSETKRGTVKRGFCVSVLGPTNDKPVPWASWSGGEAQRLRLAGNLGLSNLIRNRCHVTLPLEVWDEPTQFLSGQGVTDLLNVLAQRAQDEQRQIWVVDHRSLGYGGFSGAVTVVKGRGGSRFST